MRGAVQRLRGGVAAGEVSRRGSKRTSSGLLPCRRHGLHFIPEDNARFAEPRLPEDVAHVLLGVPHVHREDLHSESMGPASHVPQTPPSGSSMWAAALSVPHGCAPYVGFPLPCEVNPARNRQTTPTHQPQMVRSKGLPAQLRNRLSCL